MRTRAQRYALNAGEYFLAYVGGMAAVIGTYVVAGGEANARAASQLLSKALAEGGAQGAAALHALVLELGKLLA